MSETHLAKYVAVMHDGDLDVLTLWAAHTHVALECYTSPRLLLDSPVPASGKTTTLEHLQRLSAAPLQAASLSSAALLARILAKQIRTLLIDEADRNLDPKRPVSMIYSQSSTLGTSGAQPVPSLSR